MLVVMFDAKGKGLAGGAEGMARAKGLVPPVELDWIGGVTNDDGEYGGCDCGGGEVKGEGWDACGWKVRAKGLVG